jgi:phospholipid-binding lipoprotein MlaA
LVCVGLGACATKVPPTAGNTPSDPFEATNRHIDAFNQRLDKAVARPSAEAYNRTVPKSIRTCLTNVFDNLAEVGNTLNAVLQAKARQAGTDLGRLAVNTTVGFGGCFDVATPLGLERKRQNFGITLGVWGVGPGPYLVLPLLGPSTVRQTAGQGVDLLFTSPTAYVKPVGDAYALNALRFLGDRASLLSASGLVDDAALDSYSFVRDGYLQVVNNRVRDGEPAPPPVEDDPDAPDSAPTDKKGTQP